VTPDSTRRCAAPRSSSRLTRPASCRDDARHTTEHRVVVLLEVGDAPLERLPEPARRVGLGQDVEHRVGEATRARALEEEIHHHVPAAGREQVPRAFEHRLPVRDHGEAEHRDHRVDALDAQQLRAYEAGVGLDERDVLPARPIDLGARLAQHPRRPVHPEDPAGAGHTGGEQREVGAGPARHVEHRLPRPQVEELDRVDAVLMVQRLGDEVVEPREHLVVDPGHGRGT